VVLLLWWLREVLRLWVVVILRLRGGGSTWRRKKDDRSVDHSPRTGKGERLNGVKEVWARCLPLMPLLSFFDLVACQLRAAIPCAFDNGHFWWDASDYRMRYRGCEGFVCRLLARAGCMQQKDDSGSRVFVSRVEGDIIFAGRETRSFVDHLSS